MHETDETSQGRVAVHSAIPPSPSVPGIGEEASTRLTPSVPPPHIVGSGDPASRGSSIDPGRAPAHASEVAGGGLAEVASVSPAPGSQGPRTPEPTLLRHPGLEAAMVATAKSEKPAHKWMWNLSLPGLWCPWCGLTYAEAEPHCYSGPRCESCVRAPAVVLVDGFELCLNCISEEALLDEFTDEDRKRESELVTANSYEGWCDEHEFVSLKFCKVCGIGSGLENPAEDAPPPLPPFAPEPRFVTWLEDGPPDMQSTA